MNGDYMKYMVASKYDKAFVKSNPTGLSVYEFLVGNSYKVLGEIDGKYVGYPGELLYILDVQGENLHLMCTKDILDLEFSFSRNKENLKDMPTIVINPNGCEDNFNTDGRIKLYDVYGEEDVETSSHVCFCGNPVNYLLEVGPVMLKLCETCVGNLGNEIFAKMVPMDDDYGDDCDDDYEDD